MGTVTTTPPGSDAQVVNVGTDTDAIFEFSIPRGEPGGGGTPEVLATVDSTGQTSSAGSALSFNQIPLVSGSAISHTPGTPDIVINQPGIYQATFQSTVAVNGSTSIPAALEVYLTNNGMQVAGATAAYTFTTSNSLTTLAFSIPFKVDATPVNLQVIANADNFNFQDIALTVFRLGE